VGNNVMFLRRLAASNTFASGLLDIGFIERERELVAGSQLAPGATVLAAAALWIIGQERPAAASVWNSGDGWRLNGHLRRTLEFEPSLPGAAAGALAGAAAGALAVVVEYRPEGLRLGIGEHSASASLVAEGEDMFHLQYGAEGVRLQIEEDAGQLRIVIGGDEFRLRRRDPLRLSADAYVAEASLMAPMPGRVIAQLVEAGSTVVKGAPLLILEAMKMEHTICAPANGTLRGFRAAVGEQVREGVELIDFEVTPLESPRPESPRP
jgi:3-methylcrotonyl-CoA carboxylase alpha subunit